jgi:hypothetical protein
VREHVDLTHADAQNSGIKWLNRDKIHRHHSERVVVNRKLEVRINRSIDQPEPI